MNKKQRKLLTQMVFYEVQAMIRIWYGFPEDQRHKLSWDLDDLKTVAKEFDIEVDEKWWEEEIRGKGSDNDYIFPSIHPAFKQARQHEEREELSIDPGSYFEEEYNGCIDYRVVAMFRTCFKHLIRIYDRLDGLNQSEKEDDNQTQ